MSIRLKHQVVRARCWLLVTACLLSIGLTSCRVTPQSVAHSQTSQDYDRLEIIYRAHLAEGFLLEASQNSSAPVSPLVAVNESGIVPVSAQIVSPTLASESVGSGLDWSVSELRVQYPHPDKRLNYARVTLQLQPVDYGPSFERRSLRAALEEGVEIRKHRRDTRRARWFWERTPDNSGQGGATIVEFDLARSDLDRLVGELNDHGFFARDLLALEGVPSEGTAQLEVRLDRRWTARAWSDEPALEALATQVYEQGRTSIATASRSHHETHPAIGLPHWLEAKSLTPFARWR